MSNLSTANCPDPTRQVWVVAGPPGLVYVGLHKDEEDTWKIFLGWPHPEEIEHAKRHGFYAAPAACYWKRPTTTKTPGQSKPE